MEALQAYISLNRIEKFLKEDEIKPPSAEDLENFDRIAFVDATVKWNQSENKAVSNDDLRKEFIMTDLNLEFPVRELSIICEYVYNLLLTENMMTLTKYTLQVDPRDQGRYVNGNILKHHIGFNTLIFYLFRHYC